MSHRSDFFACTSRLCIKEPAFCCTITLLFAVTRVRLQSCLIPTAMSYSQLLCTRMLQVIISSKEEHVIIRDLNDLTLIIVFHVCWAPMNGASKCPIAWNNSRHAPLWLFYLHCRIEETSSLGIICIVCHQVFRHLSVHGTS